MKVTKKIKETRMQAYRNKISKHFLLFFMFLALLVGKEIQVVANPYIPNSPSRMTSPPGRIIMSEQERDSVITNAPFVFEGQMIKKVSYGYWSETDGAVYGSYLFEIEKVYRGGERLQAGTVELIVRIPRGVGHTEDVPISFLHKWYLIFAKEVEISGAVDANNSIKLELYHVVDDPSCFNEIHYEDGENKISYYAGFGRKTVKTKQELRDFLATYELYPTDISQADTLKTLSRKDIEKAKIEEQKKSQEKIIPYVSPEKADSILREINRRQRLDLDTIQNKKTEKTRKSGNENLFMTLDSIKNTTNSGNRFLEFDIVAQTDVTNTYHSLIELDLYYDADTITIDTNTFQLILGDFYKRTSCDYWMFYSLYEDVNNNNFVKIVVNDTCAPRSYKEMPTTATKLVRIKINTTGNPYETATFSFLDPATNTLQTSVKYSYSPNTFNPVPPPNYDLQLIPSPIFTLPISPSPIITNYYINEPGKISGGAGCGDTLVIQGYNFGEKDINNPEDITSTLAFKLADYVANFSDTIPYYKLKENYDYISWCDTEIKIILPSIAYNRDSSHISSDPNKKSYPVQYPGTGTFKIITSSGKEATSSGNIEIKYALRNQPFFLSDTVVKKNLYVFLKENASMAINFKYVLK